MLPDKLKLEPPASYKSGKEDLTIGNHQKFQAVVTKFTDHQQHGLDAGV